MSNGTKQNTIKNVAAISEAPLNVPQEEIGQGFLRPLGINDLLAFIQCFPTFERMLKTCHWKKKWIVILEWYFQSIPKLSGRRRNVLIPVVANALGTLLENLARLIMVEEGNYSNTKFYKSYLKERINELHTRSGISGDNSVVDDFVTIRNYSTHAKSTSISLTDREQWEIIRIATQWVDEVILWRLGYGEAYLERGLEYSINGIRPRYQLSMRDPHW